jgi:SAM-dependent methyltransferase
MSWRHVPVRRPLHGSLSIRGDACALPYANAAFDRAFSLLVLHFIPDAARAAAEMRRVVRPGGTVAAAVWDNYGGQQFTRMLWDIAGVLYPSVERPYFRPLNGPNEMAIPWRELGLKDVKQTSLLIRMEFENFDGYWAPFASGEGSHGQYVVGLSELARETLKHHLRRGYVANRPNENAGTHGRPGVSLLRTRRIRRW